MVSGKLVILGSTGSIGTQALEVAEAHNWEVSALTTNRNAKLLEAQIRKYRPVLAAAADEKAARELRLAVRDLPVKVLAGAQGVCEAASFGGTAATVLNAVVGIAGLAPTLSAICAGSSGGRKRIALANKETLVAGGALVTRLAAENDVEILPVDSEHSAIFQCLQGSADSKREIKKIILTASGGPFYGKSRRELADVTPEMALRHPNWTMGAKITVDSATLMNKGLEFMEAMWLFGLTGDQIQIAVHRESIVHSAVEFCDGAVIAQLGAADMRIPIQYALTYPQRLPSPAKTLNVFEMPPLTFAKPDLTAFKCLKVCLSAARAGGLAPAAANGANEEAVALFLQKKIGFNDIGDVVEAAAARLEPGGEASGLAEILQADADARRFVRESFGLR